jgi:hypothetical protein
MAKTGSKSKISKTISFFFNLFLSFLDYILFMSEYVSRQIIFREILEGK